MAFFHSEILIHYLCFCETIELREQHIKNLSDTQLTTEQINLLSRGLKFVPTPVMKENQIRRQLIQTLTNLPEGCAFNISIMTEILSNIHLT